MYRLIEFLLLLAAAGLLKKILRSSSKIGSAEHWILVLPCICLFVGLTYQAIAALASSGRAGSPGYYLLALVSPQSVLVASGILEVFGEKWLKLAWTVFLSVLLMVEAFGLWFLMLPYYTGLIVHEVNGSLGAAKFTGTKANDIPLMFERLNVNGLRIFGENGLIVLAILFICANLTLLVISAGAPHWPKRSISAASLG